MENLVYTIHPCPYCEAVKRLLRDLDVPFEEREVSSPEEALALKDRFGWRTFPMVILNGQFVGGYDQTRELADSGALGGILARRDAEEEQPP